MADFEDYKYQTNSGALILVKMDTATATAAGTVPTGALSVPIHGIQSKSRRTAGVHVRRMNLSRVVGTAPNQGVRYKHVPLLTPAAFDTAEGNVGGAVTIGQTAWNIASVSPEVCK